MREIGAEEIAALARVHAEVLIDLGTGDGRFVRHVALERPDHLAIGLDACRENLRAVSHTSPPNALYVIANALDLLRESNRPGGGLGVAARYLTVNFPWGSLLRGLLDGEPSLWRGIQGAAAPDALLEIRLNAGALAEEGRTLGEGTSRIAAAIRDAGFEAPHVTEIDRASLRALSSTWAKRIAFGRDPRAVHIRASFPGERRCRAPPFLPDIRGWGDLQTSICPQKARSIGEARMSASHPYATANPA
jgi:16S rRNA (adenine(1408)-N(1))-methyltransferase